MNPPGSKRRSRLATCGERLFFLSPAPGRMTGGFEVRSEVGNHNIGRAYTLAAARSMIRQHLNRPRAAVSFKTEEAASAAG